MKRNGVWTVLKLGGVVLAGVAFALPTASVTETVAEANAGPDIAGSYSIAGEGGGVKYTGTATISKIAGSMLKGKWSIGDNTFLGVGFQDDDDFSCGWSTKEKDANVVAYLVREDGLDGVWFEEGDTALGLEYLQPVGKMKKDLGGNYTIGSMKDGKWSAKGKQPNGDPYTGSVVVKKRGEIGEGVYQFTWKFGANTEDGVGVRNVDSGQDDVISVGFADKADTFGALQYNIQKGGKVLLGTWVQTGDGGSLKNLSTGTEKLTRM
jgi:hypothetical protein